MLAHGASFLIDAQAIDCRTNCRSSHYPSGPGGQAGRKLSLTAGFRCVSKRTQRWLADRRYPLQRKYSSIVCIICFQNA